MGAASAVLAVVVAPVTPVVLAAAGLGLASGTAIPGAECCWIGGMGKDQPGKRIALPAESMNTQDSQAAHEKESR